MINIPWMTSLVVLMAAIALAVEPPPNETALALFNGKDLSGWQTKGNWVVGPDGAVTLQPRERERGWQRLDHYLMTQQVFTNFVLDLEFQTKGDSGVLIGAVDALRCMDFSCEVQVSSIPDCGFVLEWCACAVGRCQTAQ